MKKVRIELKNDQQIKSLLIFESSEALYIFLKDEDPLNKCVMDGPIIIDIPLGAFVVDIFKDDYVEAELRGFEYVFEGNSVFQRLDYVRFAKSTPTKNKSGVVISTYHGWVTSDRLSFNNVEDEVSTTKLLKNDEPQLDLYSIFQDENDSSEDEVVNTSVK